MISFLTVLGKEKCRNVSAYDQCASAIAECEHAAGIRVEMEFQFDDRSQAGIALAEIRNPACQIDRCAS